MKQRGYCEKRLKKWQNLDIKWQKLFYLYFVLIILNVEMYKDINLYEEKVDISIEEDVESDYFEVGNNDDVQKVLSMHLDEMKELNFKTSWEIYSELNSFIESISQQYSVPFDILTTIIHQESGGNWNTNGVKSYSNDYGLTQINECNLEKIYKELGFTKEEILFESKKAIEAQAFIIKEIFEIYEYDLDNFDYRNVFGTYNGWINWRDKELAINYADSCMKILNSGGVEKTLTR